MRRRLGRLLRACVRAVARRLGMLEPIDFEGLDQAIHESAVRMGLA